MYSIMAINLANGGRSVYVSDNLEQKSGLDLFRAARELVGRYSNGGGVLDIGCSDGAATHGLESFCRVYGVDLSEDAIVAALNSNPNYLGVVADMQNLPFRLSAIDTVLMLDVVEHERWPVSLDVLRQLREGLATDHTLIISMPIISYLSRATWREKIRYLRDGERPPVGLFDRTHHILTSKRGHARLFSEAGYEIVEQHQTNDCAGVEPLTGDWEFQREAGSLAVDTCLDGAAPTPEPMGILRRIGGIVTRSILHPSREISEIYTKTHSGGRFSRLAPLSEKLVAYQGIYVLKPASILAK